MKLISFAKQELLKAGWKNFSTFFVQNCTTKIPTEKAPKSNTYTNPMVSFGPSPKLQETHCPLELGNPDHYGLKKSDKTVAIGNRHSGDRIHIGDGPKLVTGQNPRSHLRSQL